MKCTITSYELRAINYRCFGRLTLQIVIIKVFSFYSRKCTWYFWLALAYVQTLVGSRFIRFGSCAPAVAITISITIHRRPSQFFSFSFSIFNVVAVIPRVMSAMLLLV